MCDSLYDLFHLNDAYGQEDVATWWLIRKFTWACLWGEPPYDYEDSDFA